LEDLGGVGNIILKINFTIFISKSARQLDTKVLNHKASLLRFPTIANL
jgi:hypothetical protein